MLEDLRVANDGPKYVIDSERAHVIKSSADVADFTEVGGVDSVLGVAIPGHKASDLTGKEDSLHVLVLERESSEKSFPYLLSDNMTQEQEQKLYVDFQKAQYSLLHVVSENFGSHEVKADYR